MTKKESSRIFWGLVGIDLLIVLLNVVPTENSGIDQFLSLDLESNFVTWYSSSKLLIAALLCFSISKETRNSRWLICFVGLALLGISMSETAMFHERLSGAIYTIRNGGILTAGAKGIWVLYLAPVCALVLLLLGYAAIKISREFPAIRWPFIGVAVLWLGVLIAETAARWAGEMSPSELKAAMIVEESCEIFGATMMLYALSAAWRQISSNQQVVQEAV